MKREPQIVLGVSGSIAAYKAAELVRLMVARGWGVSVLAAIAILAPSFAARNAIAKPIPRVAPVMKRVFPLKVVISAVLQNQVSQLDFQYYHF